MRTMCFNSVWNVRPSMIGLGLAIAVSVLAVTRVSTAQSLPIPEDVATIDGIIKAYYEVVSGPAGQARQWDRDSSLHLPDALVLIVSNDSNGDINPNTMTLEEYHDATGNLSESGFFESEIHRVESRHGSVAHVWSTYQWKRTPDGPIGGQGINSIQLVHDGHRWWIASWMFDGRRDAPPVPDVYLPPSNDN